MLQPVLQTPRLRLRPFTPADAADVHRLVGDREVAHTTANIPHPYPEGAAEAWIASHAAGLASGRAIVYAITDRESGALWGAIGMMLAPEHQRAELGYWIARAEWGKGLATEALRAVLEFAFTTLALERVDATFMTRNPASGRVMAKAGMRHEGLHRRFYKRDGRFEDIIRYAIMREEWGQAPPPAPEPAWKVALRSQLGAALDALENAIGACPEALWNTRGKYASGFGDMAFHTIFFLDFYLAGRPEGFAPPAPFGLEELDPAGVLPPRVYTPDELRAYVAHVRRKAATLITAMDEARAASRSEFLQRELSELDVLLYNTRHVQHHVGQLQMLLRQAGVEPPRWVRASTGLAG